LKENIIGGADEPTYIFLGENIGLGWINIFGFVIVVLMILPNMLYALKFHGIDNKCKNKVMNILEQIGRYSSMFLIIFNIGFIKFGFTSVEAFVFYYIGNAILLIVYYIIWILYFQKITLWKSMILAIIPTAIFLISGITLRHYLLVISAIIFGVGHIYVTCQNVKLK